MFYKITVNMCKKGGPPNKHETVSVEQNQTTNYGLINVSSSSISDISPLEIIEIAGFAILCIGRA